MAGAPLFRRIVGSIVTAVAIFTEVDGTLADPGVVTFTVERPDESTYALAFPADPAVVHDSVGQFHVDIPTDQHGTWTVEVVPSVSGPIAVQNGNFVIDSSAID